MSRVLGRSCVDCGLKADGDYLCRRCARERRLARCRAYSKVRYAKVRADARLLELKRQLGRDWARAHYVPKIPTTKVEPCRAVACTKTFVRVWHATNRMFCDEHSRFFAREAENERSRRRYAKKLRRAA